MAALGGLRLHTAGSGSGLKSAAKSSLLAGSCHTKVVSICFSIIPVWGVSQNWGGYRFGGPYNEDYNILGSILGYLEFGKLPYSYNITPIFPQYTEADATSFAPASCK